jgi:hydrogenase-4 component B
MTNRQLWTRRVRGHDAVGTREIDHMGGLAKTMPRTSFLFLVGAVAICGLPPLNGFVSELLIYLGLFRTLGLDHGRPWTAAAAAVPALAMIGALAVACFVKVFGAVFLGTARRSRRAHEAPGSMVVPMAALALCCLAIGVVPILTAPILDRAVAAWTRAPANPSLASLVPFHWISLLGGALIVAIVLGRTLLAGRKGAEVVTWDCGYAASSTRIQYTSSSFAEMLVGLFRWVLRPRTHPPHVKGVFPAGTGFESHVDDTMLEGVMSPVARIVLDVSRPAASWAYRTWLSCSRASASS